MFGLFPSSAWGMRVGADLGVHRFVWISERSLRLKRARSLGPEGPSVTLTFSPSFSVFKSQMFGSDKRLLLPHQEVRNFRKEIWIDTYHKECYIFGFHEEWGL